MMRNATTGAAIIRGPIRLRVLAAVALAALTAGCVDNLARRDAISPFAGDVQAQAIAAQTINPWPKAAYRKEWRSRPLPTTTSTSSTTSSTAPSAATR